MVRKAIENQDKLAQATVMVEVSVIGVRGMSISAAAKYLGVNAKVIRRLIAEGELKYFVLGQPAGARKSGAWLIDRIELDSLVEQRKVAS